MQPVDDRSLVPPLLNVSFVGNGEENMALILKVLPVGRSLCCNLVWREGGEARGREGERVGWWVGWRIGREVGMVGGRESESRG